MSSTVRAPYLRLGWGAWLLTLAVLAVARLLGAAWRHPWIAAGIVAIVLLRLAVVERGFVVLLPFVFVVVALLAWRRIGPSTFEAAVGRTVRSRWRRATVYRREWQPALVVTGLEGRVGDRPPRLLGVDSAPDRDEVLVRMAPGQTVDEWQAQGKRLAAVFGVRSVRARRAPRGRDRLVLHARRHGAPIAPTAVDLTELPELDDAPRGAFPKAPR